MMKNCDKCGVSIQVQPLYKVSDKDEPIAFWCEPCIKKHENVKYIVFWGDGDTFKLICKASSKEEGWMKSTNTFVPGVKIEAIGTGIPNGDGVDVKKRRLVPIKYSNVVMD